MVTGEGEVAFRQFLQRPAGFRRPFCPLAQGLSEPGESRGIDVEDELVQIRKGSIERAQRAARIGRDVAGAASRPVPTTLCALRWPWISLSLRSCRLASRFAVINNLYEILNDVHFSLLNDVHVW